METNTRAQAHVEVIIVWSFLVMADTGSTQIKTFVAG